MTLKRIMTQNSVKDSDPFEIIIWKDQARTMKIATLADGGVLSADRLSAGPLSGLKMTPENEFVQKTNKIEVKFTTTHELQPEAAVTIRLPPGITTPLSKAIVLVQSTDFSANGGDRKSVV